MTKIEFKGNPDSWKLLMSATAVGAAILGYTASSSYLTNADTHSKIAQCGKESATPHEFQQCMHTKFPLTVPVPIAGTVIHLPRSFGTTGIR